MSQAGQPSGKGQRRRDFAPRRFRFPIVWRIFAAAMLTLTVGFGAVLAIVERIVDDVVYAEIDARVVVAQKTFWELVRQQGSPAIVAGRLRLGSWTVNGQNSLVDHVKELTGADATLFEMIGTTPIRVTTTILKLHDRKRNIGTELLGPARHAIDAGHSFAGVSPVADRDFINRYDVLRDATGRIVGVVYAGIPLTTRDATAAKIKDAIMVSTAWALAICLALLYVVTNPFRRIFERTAAVARGLARGDVDQESGVVSNDEVGDMNAAFREMIAYQQRMASVADAIADGDLSLSIEPVSDNDRLGVAFRRMLGNLRNYVRQLETLAATDGLTQLGNLRSFREQLAVALSTTARTGQSFSLVLVDIDRFKAINDARGHQHGDKILVRLGTLLTSLRAHDRAYRLGGDEFALILPAASAAEAKIALERLREDAPRQLFGATLSFGVASSDDGRISAEDLQRQADIALYIGKKNGRNSVVVFGDTLRPRGTGTRRIGHFVGQ